MKSDQPDVIIPVEGVQPTPLPNRHPEYKLNKFIFLAIILLFGIYLFVSLINFFSAFLGAVMFYVLSKRFMEYLVKKKRWGKGSAASLVVVISLIIIMIPVTLMVILLYEKIKIFLADPAIIENTLTNINQSIRAKYNIQLMTPQNKNNIMESITSNLSNVLNKGINFFITIAMLYFFLFFMLINLNRMEAAIVFYLPFKRTKIEMFGKELVNQTYANAVVVPMIALVQGLIGFIGYMIAGLPEPGFWAIVTAFATIIPVIGTALVWIPAVVYLFISGHSGPAVFLLLYSAIILGLADNVIRFFLAKKIAKVHEVVTVLGIIIGLKSFGLPGLIFGPLMISYFLILLKIYYAEFQNNLIVKKRKSTPIRFNLPFLGTVIKKRPRK
ncbi:MAG: AI-2E family transporter [Chitinophagaceae bacterium]|nr:AI-2E family transporter [Chitinophagaceae bacterium]